jgi:hypothetical protein
LKKFEKIKIINKDIKINKKMTDKDKDKDKDRYWLKVYKIVEFMMILLLVYLFIYIIVYKIYWNIYIFLLNITKIKVYNDCNELSIFKWCTTQENNINIFPYSYITYLE